MPELAEVERGRLLIENALAGKTIIEVNANEQGGGPRDGQFDEIVFQGSTCPEDVAKHFLQRQVVSAHRLGKQLWLTLAGHGLQPTFHFGMTGSFAVQGGQSMEYQRYTVDTAVWPPRFCKLELVADDGTRLAFVNSRRLGRVRFFDDPTSHPPISKLGFDPLLSLPPLPVFTAALAARGQAIKAVLLDQSFSAGVGNWIADEVVYQAGIHPSHPCSALTLAEAGALHSALGTVVRTAVEANADSKKFPPDWLFHFRWVKGSAGAKDAHGHPITFLTVGGRTSAVVAAVQPTSVWSKRDATQHIGHTHAGEGSKSAASPKRSRQRPAAGPSLEPGQVAAAASARSDASSPVAVKGKRSAGPKVPTRAQRRGTKRAREPVAEMAKGQAKSPGRRRSPRLAGGRSAT